MSNLFLDTNIFIYLGENHPKFANEISAFLSKVQTENYQIVTSAETIQEIIHLAKNQHDLPKGLKTARLALEMVKALLPITQDTCQIYLDNAGKYPARSSRDLIQLSSCIENKIDTIVTYDSDFQKFKELTTLTPAEFLFKQVGHWDPMSLTFNLI